jgi:hypothetical protein
MGARGGNEGEIPLSLRGVRYVKFRGLNLFLGGKNVIPVTHMIIEKEFLFKWVT